MELQDTLFQQNLRQVVLNQIAADHSISEEVIDAMKKIPRHYFVGEYQQEDAYEDKPLQIASGQTISQITTVAVILPNRYNPNLTCNINIIFVIMYPNEYSLSNILY